MHHLENIFTRLGWIRGSSPAYDKPEICGLSPRPEHPRGFPLFFANFKKRSVAMLLPTNFMIELGLNWRDPAGREPGYWRLGRGPGMIVSAGAVGDPAAGRRSENFCYIRWKSRFPGLGDGGQGKRPNGIIVLGGSIDADLSVAHGTTVIRPPRATRVTTGCGCSPIAYPKRQTCLYRRQRQPAVERRQGSRIYVADLFAGLGIAPFRAC